MHGIWRPKLPMVPWRRGLGNVLHIPAACKPDLRRGLVIWFHSWRVRDNAGAGYLRVLMIVVCNDSSALC